MALGHVVGHGGVRMDPAKVSAIMEMAPPTNVKQLQRFLGMCAFYSWLLEDLSRMANPLHDLTLLSAEWVWGPPQEAAFRELRGALARHVVMMAPDMQRPFLVVTDASLDGFAAILAQRDEQGIERPVRFWSKRTSACQRNWSATHLECGAVVLAMREFAHYLGYGLPFAVVTDHQALEAVLSLPNPKGKIAR